MAINSDSIRNANSAISIRLLNQSASFGRAEILAAQTNVEHASSPAQGQVEYEMPLLAPVKDKRDLVLDEEAVDRTPIRPEFVHILLKKR